MNMSERGAPMSAVAFRRMLTRVGPAAKMPFGIHPHMLRHSTGFKLANQSVDTRALQNEQQRFKRTDAPIRLLQISISQSLLGDFCKSPLKS